MLLTHQFISEIDLCWLQKIIICDKRKASNAAQMGWLAGKTLTNEKPPLAAGGDTTTDIVSFCMDKAPPNRQRPQPIAEC
ncbi:hypothetical protein SAMN02746095_02390 [Acidocella aminolytica 101 = DSM 11237]|jgi:hypothetical protein|nr:hypothetical protein SAMN02746095_02390 [Acidocella aminolytica 101 = DSM 11237]